MESEKSSRQNRVREALGRIYDQHPPHFREYLRRYKEDPTSRVFAPLAEAYRRMGRVDDAIEVCREGLEHHPDFHGGRVALAKCYLDKKRFTDARQELDRVVQFAPENLMAQRLLADVCLQLGDRKASLHASKMALMLSPSDVALAEKIHVLEREVETEVHAVKLEENTVTSEVRLPTRVDPPSPKQTPEEAVAEILAPHREESSIAVSPQKNATLDAKIISEADEVASILSDDHDADEAFTIEHVSSVFSAAKPPGQQGITTSTLGDLYFSQGQYDRALRIFERLASTHPTVELNRKIQMARSKLGVDPESMLRNRRIEVLRAILKSVQTK